MRIQHNIMAMNSYRNYTNNTKAVSKNLEKLSSGYRINRAGDDAAGLAISEKMRAQITGLKTAEKNAKDGISLVQTAEGALTEVHSMLNRMAELADQSANGTYDNEVDRANLQKEVSALNTEIDRIADSSNFNGIKLLDGSLGGKADIAGNISLADTKVTFSKATSGNFTAFGADNDGTTSSFTIAWKDSAGKEYSKTVELTMKKAAGGDTLVAKDGTSYAAGTTNTGLGDKNSIQSAVLAELKKDSTLTSAFDIEVATDALSFTAKQGGTAGAQITAIGGTNGASTGGMVGAGSIAAGSTVGKDAMQKLDLTKAPVLAAADAKAEDIAKATFEIGGKKFVLAANTATADHLKNVPGDVNIIKLAGAAYNAGNDAANVSKEISRVTGMKFESAAAVDNGAGISANDILYKGDTALKATGKDLVLQIGDTAEDFNKLAVRVGDMHTASLGINSVDVSSQTGASDAIAKIKTAINTVSSTRGDLGATQNRLDHTINNLSVMRENIQDAESSIRDVDVAEEMMAYTKNNILVQSAQAMLAQANQAPQGVLQLLQ